MTYRELLKNKTVALVLFPLSAVVLIAVVWSYSGASGAPAQLKSETYSDDDGATWFSDAARKITPFEHNGKQAVYASVAKGPDGKQYVAFLARHTEAARHALAQASNEGPPMVKPFMEFKKPRSAEPWIPDNDPRSAAIREPGTGLEASR